MSDSATLDAKVASDFESYSSQIESERLLRQSVKVASARLDSASRACLLRLRAAHRPGGLQDVRGICAAARDRLGECRLALVGLAELLPDPDAQFRHQHQWRRAAQRLALSVSLLHFLERGRPATRAQAAAELGLATPADPRLPLGDHLHGLLALAAELARLSVTAVIGAADQRELPRRALECVTEIRRGFRLMLTASAAAAAEGGGGGGCCRLPDAAAASALASAEARLGAELAKIEDVVYDLAVRGLRAA